MKIKVVVQRRFCFGIKRLRLYIIRFDRPYRAAALVDSLQPDFGELRLDWFRRSDKDFDVVLLYEDEQELERGKQLLIARGFQ